MLEVTGKHNSAKIFTDNIEQEALSQIIELCNQEFCKDSKIRIMPDVHAGAGCTIGTTMTITDKVVSNLVGVDIGCGMCVSILKEKDIDLNRLDSVIRNFIPSGFDVREAEHKYSKRIPYNNLKAKINLQRAKLSVGTLGGGNHFIEVNRDKEGYLYIVIHSGSRHLGKQIAEHYQSIAINELLDLKGKKIEIINSLKAQGKEKEIPEALNKLSAPKINKNLAYLQNESFQNYLQDMKIAQEYADWNRKAITDEIINQMGLVITEQFTTIHNYIDFHTMILRKGAISAQRREKVIVPINMRDGSIIAIGKGNPEWNFSAPHGAGRLMSRSKAKQNISMAEFTKSMEGIYSTSINQSTLDEAPMAYKPINEILDNIQDAVEVIDVIKPIYNFKSS